MQFEWWELLLVQGELDFSAAKTPPQQRGLSPAFRLSI